MCVCAVCACACVCVRSSPQNRTKTPVVPTTQIGTQSDPITHSITIKSGSLAIGDSSPRQFRVLLDNPSKNPFCFRPIIYSQQKLSLLAEIIFLAEAYSLSKMVGLQVKMVGIFKTLKPMKRSDQFDIEDPLCDFIFLALGVLILESFSHSPDWNLFGLPPNSGRGAIMLCYVLNL